MSNPATASTPTSQETIVGLCSPAADNLRLLAKQIKRIVGAPDDVKDIANRELEFLPSAVDLLSMVNNTLWYHFELPAVRQTAATLNMCIMTCASLERRIHSWTRSIGGMVTWRSDVDIDDPYKSAIFECSKLILRTCQRGFALTCKIACRYVHEHADFDEFWLTR